LVKPSTY